MRLHPERTLTIVASTRGSSRGQGCAGAAAGKHSCGRCHRASPPPPVPPLQGTPSLLRQLLHPPECSATHTGGARGPWEQLCMAVGCRWMNTCPLGGLTAICAVPQDSQQGQDSGEAGGGLLSQSSTESESLRMAQVCDPVCQFFFFFNFLNGNHDQIPMTPLRLGENSLTSSQADLLQDS